MDGFDPKKTNKTNARATPEGKNSTIKKKPNGFYIISGVLKDVTVNSHVQRRSINIKLIARRDVP